LRKDVIKTGGELYYKFKNDFKMSLLDECNDVDEMIYHCFSVENIEIYNRIVNRYLDLKKIIYNKSDIMPES
jgi:hypothetical protein